MKSRPRILFVCFADSPHAQSWMNLLWESNFDVRVFSLLPPKPDKNTPLDIPRNWAYPTYIVMQPDPANNRTTSNLKWLFPNWRGFGSLFLWLIDRFQLIPKWLKWILLTWKPDIVHSFPLNTGGKPVMRALSTMARKQWPRWVVSSWGSDIFIGLKDDTAKKYLDFIFESCDGYFSDCDRDLKLALGAGLSPGKLALPHAVPGTGGLDLDFFSAFKAEKKMRNVILIPKAFERAHANRAFTIVEALVLEQDVIQSYEVHLLSCSKNVQLYLSQMPQAVQKRCHIHEMLPQNELFSLLSRSRVMVAPSLSDGTPNVMLEAMAAGAIPIMSPIASHQEWITDGENGLLAHALYPDQIASALKRALTDDKLFEQAQRLNWEIVCQRADRRKVREKVLTYYRTLYKTTDKQC
jgi:glycosyltransferase involved in cell wall biosynthesis